MVFKVAPRDVFNDANFIKNLAFLVKSIENGELKGIDVRIRGDEIYSPRFLEINPDDGGLRLSNNKVFNRETQEPLFVRRSINDRDPFPLFLETEDYEEFQVFNNDGTLHNDVKENFSQGGNVDLLVSSKDLFAYSFFLKGVARVALNSIPGVDKYNGGFLFDEEQYSSKGLLVAKDDEYITLKNKRLILKGGEPLTFRSPAEVSPDDLWPLEYSTDGESFERVFDERGQYREQFLNKEGELKLDKKKRSMDFDL